VSATSRETGEAGPALVARGLSVGFGRTDALADVNLAVPAGTRVAVLGPNGAGKSTLFLAAIGLISPRRGSVELGGRRVAFVPQRLDLEPSFPVTVLDVVRMGRYGELGPLRRFGDRDHALVETAMRELGIAHLAGRRFGDLSGGERQRALLAQAAAQDAQILLLDEPLTGVDAPTRGVVHDLLARWRAEGRTALVATHDLESAASDFDLVLCLNRRVVALGPPAQTLTEPVLAETFAGHVIRVGGLIVDVDHHHAGAG
jgi:manganese/iron transport system ATP-binding protein